ncbi:MAG: hypothetical protein KKD07_03670 [Candidatus Omnitrophica bacterium]|nr:hypothetical protein [Candidatus Omnitrophota bacterium]MBU1996911.1 hypothetical protein [Candidatus Omnitrophota bacterium]MBU4333523.1 hypothetical protein [Candidatus Omnitrophota bacterium]
MRKFIIAFVLLGLIFLCSGQTEAAKTETKSYRISATIPAIVGLNVKDVQTFADEEAKPNTDDEIGYEEYAVVRNNQTFILRTSVLK